MRRSYSLWKPLTPRQLDARKEARLRNEGIIGGPESNDEAPHDVWWPCDYCGDNAGRDRRVCVNCAETL